MKSAGGASSSLDLMSLPRTLLTSTRIFGSESAGVNSQSVDSSMTMTTAAIFRRHEIASLYFFTMDIQLAFDDFRSGKKTNRGRH